MDITKLNSHVFQNEMKNWGCLFGEFRWECWVTQIYDSFKIWNSWLW